MPKWTDFDTQTSIEDANTFLVFNSAVSAVRQVSWATLVSAIDVEGGFLTSEEGEALVSSASVSLQALVSNIAVSIEGITSVLQISVSSLDSRVSAIETSVSNLDSLVSSVQTSVSSLDSRVSAIETSVSNLDSLVSSVQTSVSQRLPKSGNEAMEGTLDLGGYGITNVSVVGTSVSGILYIPSGTSSDRPGSPSTTGIRYNTDEAAFEGWNGASWGNLGGTSSAVTFFNTRTSAASTTISPTTHVIFTGGYTSAGDGGQTFYYRVSTEPSHPGKFQDSGGAWFEIIPGEKGINVKALGAKGNGSTDDTSAFHDARDVALVLSRKLYIPQGQYIVSNLNFTKIQGFIIQGDGVNVSRLNPPASPSGNWIDFSGSLQFVVRDLQIGYFNQPSGYATGIMLAQVSDNTSNQFYFENVYLSGSYSIAAFYDYGVPSSQSVNCDYYNYTSGAGTHAAIRIEEVNNAAVSSAFVTLANVTANAGNWSFIGNEFHKFSGAGANNGTIRLGGTCQGINWSGCVITGGAFSYVYVDSGNVSENVFTACTFETESSPVTPSHIVYTSAGSSFDGKLLKPHTILAATPLGGSGSFTVDGYWQSYTPTISATTGAITSATPSGRWSREENVVTVNIDAIVSSNGTGADALLLGLPYTAAGFTHAISLGRNRSTGEILQAVLSPGSPTAAVYKATGVYPVSSGEALTVSFQYEV